MATFVDTVFSNFARNKGFLVLAAPLPPGLPPQLREEVRKMFSGTKLGYGELFKNICKDAETVEVSNVTEWMFAETDRDSWSLEDGDFPACIPPFKRMVIETRAPSRVVSKEFRLPGAEELAKKIMPRRWAVVIDSYTIEEAETLWAKKKEGSTAEGVYLNNMQHTFGKIAADPEIRIKVKFVIVASVFAWTFGWALIPNTEGDTDSTIGPLSSMLWAVDATGNLIGKPETTMSSSTIETAGAIIGVPDVPDDVKFDLAQALFSGNLYYPALMAITMMNCKNVRLETVDPPTKLNKRRVKDGKRPMVRYHTLSIEPFTKSVHSGAGADPTGRKVAMHVVRGHLKDYREGKGLFGKKKGLWWWSPHLTGSPEAGTVVKDYEIAKKDS